MPATCTCGCSYSSHRRLPERICFFCDCQGFDPARFLVAPEGTRYITATRVVVGTFILAYENYPRGSVNYKWAFVRHVAYWRTAATSVITFKLQYENGFRSQHVDPEQPLLMAEMAIDPDRPMY